MKKMTTNKRKLLPYLLTLLAVVLIVILYLIINPKNLETNFRQVCETIKIGSSQSTVDKLMKGFPKEIKSENENIIYLKSKKWFDFEACSVFLKDDKVVDTKYILD